MNFDDFYREIQLCHDMTNKLIRNWNEISKMQTTLKNGKDICLRHGISEEEYNNLLEKLEEDIKRLQEEIIH